METKYVRVPFEVELAKKITEKSVVGRIVTNFGKEVRIICFNMLNEKAPIIGLRRDDNFNETALSFNVRGYCVQNTDCYLILELPEYMTFKDGDVIVCDKIVLLFSGDVNQYDLCGCYCSLFGDTESLDLNFDYKGVLPETRLATESEKQKLINALKASKEPKAKEYLKRFFGIEVKPECEFKPFDKVIALNKETKWYPDFFSFIDEDNYFVCIGGYYKECIPYNEQTAHLLGTTGNYEYKF